MRQLSQPSRLERDLARLLLIHGRSDIKETLESLTLTKAAKWHPQMRESKKILRNIKNV